MTKSNHWNLPRYIGICGNPKSGKSLVQEILRNNYDVTPIDDGQPLRNIAMDYFGLTWRQVYTQEGKAEFVNILGRKSQVREILGELGNRLEAMFGDQVMPFMATRKLVGVPGSFSFGSVRKNQGRYYRDHGGILIGVRSPDAKSSPYAFDKFDESLIDIWIDNDGLARGLHPERAKLDLANKLHDGLTTWLAGKVTAVA